MLVGVAQRTVGQREGIHGDLFLIQGLGIVGHHLDGQCSLGKRTGIDNRIKDHTRIGHRQGVDLLHLCRIAERWRDEVVVHV
ncbi:hypothetical protein SDC9_190300 [bioreactor metagenome]|uniref:Uncharacterized protein n=1 Tax=bioreactor metagenome TaxID=1076179 RepID=A0A645I5J8_9ZZZZ